jgi:hypothetical protein
MSKTSLYLSANLLDYRAIAERFVGGDVKSFFDNRVAGNAGAGVIALVVVTLPVLLARYLYQKKIFVRL